MRHWYGYNEPISEFNKYLEKNIRPSSYPCFGYISSDTYRTDKNWYVGFDIDGEDLVKFVDSFNKYFENIKMEYIGEFVYFMGKDPWGDFTRLRKVRESATDEEHVVSFYTMHFSNDYCKLAKMAIQPLIGELVRLIGRISPGEVAEDLFRYCWDMDQGYLNNGSYNCIRFKTPFESVLLLDNIELINKAFEREYYTVPGSSYRIEVSVKKEPRLFYPNRTLSMILETATSIV